MAMRGKMRSGGGGRRRTRSKSDDSDASDDDYKIEDDGEFEDSDEYCSSLAGEELEDDLVRGTRRLKRRNSFLSKSKGRARKVSKERKVSYEEDGVEAFVEDDDDVDEEENGKNWATGFPKRKRNAVPKGAKKKKASYTKENDEDEAEDSDQDDDDNGNEDDKDLQSVVMSRKQNRVQKAVKEVKSAYMEENEDDDDDDDDYEAGDDAVDDDDEDYNGIEGEKDKRKGCPSRKQSRVRKTLKKKKASYMEESDDNYEAEEDSGDDVEDCNGIEDEKNFRKGCAGRKKNGVAKARKKKVSDTEESDDNYEAEDDECDDDDNYDDNEDEKDLQNGCLGRKQNGVQKELEEKKVMEENDDEYEAEDDECDGYNDIGDEKVLQNGCPGRKQNGVQKARKEKKASYTEESDDDYEAEDDECDEDDDYNDIEDEQDLPNVYPDRKPNGDKKALKKKKALYTEEDDDDHEAAEDDECDEDTDNGIEKDGCSSRKQYGVQKGRKENKASYREENDDDYKAEDNEFNDDDDYDNEEEEESEEEEELEEEDDDEDFTPNEIDFDDEDEFPAEEKAKRVRRTHSQGKRCPGGRKKRKRSTIKSKTKEPAKRRGFQRKSSSGRRKKVKKRKSCVKETNERNPGRKRRRLLVDSDSDFVDSKPLLLDQEYTISEEEREQVREANKFCGNLTVALRNCSSNKRSVEEENLHQERNQKARKGKDKLEGLKVEVAKQVCGICFSEEGKRTIRGTLDCCSHYFCFNCIMEWSKVESRCPLCKQRFATISKPARSDTSFDLRTTVVPVPERDQVYQPSEEELRSYLDPYENVICTECHHGGDDANMLLCDLCDSPAHTYCVGLGEVPEGNWYCEGCRPTAIGPSNPQTPNFSRDRRTTNDLFARSSSPSANIRETIDLNRVYEPETPLFEGTGISSSPRPVNGDLQAGSSIPGGVGVQTVRERRRRHQQMAHFVGRNVANIGLGPEVEWGRTRRLGFQNSIRPETSSIYDIFSQGSLHDNFTSPVPSMRLLSATPSHSRVHRAFGQTLTRVNGSPDGSGSLQAGLSGITGGDAWSFHGHPSRQ